MEGNGSITTNSWQEALKDAMIIGEFIKKINLLGAGIGTQLAFDFDKWIDLGVDEFTLGIEIHVCAIYGTEEFWRSS